MTKFIDSYGPNGLKCIIYMVSVKQRRNCKFLVWNSFQSYVFTMGVVWVQLDPFWRVSIFNYYTNESNNN